MDGCKQDDKIHGNQKKRSQKTIYQQKRKRKTNYPRKNINAHTEILGGIFFIVFYSRGHFRIMFRFSQEVRIWFGSSSQFEMPVIFSILFNKSSQ